MSPALEQTIRQTYERLPAGERKIADVLLEVGGELAAYSATELAGRAGVSKATATRLVRRLGYADYQHLRQQVRSRHSGSPLAELGGAPLAGSLARHLDHDVACLTRTFEAISPEQVRAAVDVLATSARIWVIGFRNSHALALYARQLLVQVKPDVRLLPLPGQTLAEDLSAMAPGDAVLMLGFRRRPAMFADILRAICETGAKVILLADPSIGVSADRAAVSFQCLGRGSSLFDSYVAPISLINHLCAEIVRVAGSAGQDRLARSEELHDAFGDF